ncbi:MAG: hypothetical protein ACRD4I_05040, partial [Candidatus Angelobacter sp.]
IGSSTEHHFYFDVMERALITFGARVLLPDFPVMREADLCGLRLRTTEEQSPFAHREFLKLLDFLLLHKQFELQPRRCTEAPAPLRSGIKAGGKRREFLVRHLGAILGAELHDAYVAGILGKSYLRALFFRKTHLPGVAKRTYFDLAKQIGTHRNRLG